MCNHIQYKAVNTRSFLVPGSEVYILTFGALRLYMGPADIHVILMTELLAELLLNVLDLLCRAGLVPITSAKYQLNFDIITKAVLNWMVTTSRLITSGKKTTFEYIKILILYPLMSPRTLSPYALCLVRQFLFVLRILVEGHTVIWENFVVKIFS